MEGVLPQKYFLPHTSLCGTRVYLKLFSDLLSMSLGGIQQNAMEEFLCFSF